MLSSQSTQVALMSKNNIQKLFNELYNLTVQINEIVKEKEVPGNILLKNRDRLIKVLESFARTQDISAFKNLIIEIESIDEETLQTIENQKIVIQSKIRENYKGKKALESYNINKLSSKEDNEQHRDK